VLQRSPSKSTRRIAAENAAPRPGLALRSSLARRLPMSEEPKGRDERKTPCLERGPEKFNPPTSVTTPPESTGKKIGAEESNCRQLHALDYAPIDYRWRCGFSTQKTPTGIPGSQAP